MNKKILGIAAIALSFVVYLLLNIGNIQSILEQSETSLVQKAYNSDVPCKEWKLHYGKCIKCIDAEAHGLKKYYNLYCIDGCANYCAEW